jgi:hypothetical protein
LAKITEMQCLLLQITDDARDDALSVIHQKGSEPEASVMIVIDYFKTNRNEILIPKISLHTPSKQKNN